VGDCRTYSGSTALTFDAVVDEIRLPQPRGLPNLPIAPTGVRWLPREPTQDTSGLRVGI
jgi:hypothetical protein